MNTANILSTISIMILPLIFAITLHEAAHGWVASKLGDKTALMLGRVTLNPTKHIDPMGTVILPIAMMVITNFNFLFGWAKPVPVTWANLRNPRRDMAIVALAGPISNLLMAFMWAGSAKLALITQTSSPSVHAITEFFKYAGVFGIQINCFLLILNLIPIPPLDGSRVVSALLPRDLSAKYDSIEPYGIWILLGFLFLFGRVVLVPPVMQLMNFISGLFGLR